MTETKKQLEKKVKELEQSRKELLEEQDERNELVMQQYNTIAKLKKEAKEGDMYRKACSVLMAAVDEKRLAWSLACEYDRQKGEHTRKVDVSSIFEKGDFFDDLKEAVEEFESELDKKFKNKK
jgi:predicted S18 family serine protease